MAEWTYALASVAELKQILGVASTDTGQDAVFEAVLKRASEVIEAYLGRQVVTRGALTEYHTVDGSVSELRLLEWPVIAITTVKEGGLVNGTWTPDLTLTSTAGDYQLRSSASGRASLARMTAAGSVWSWATGVDAVQVVYSAGYATTATVPGVIKDVCLSLAARKYSEIRRGQAGAQSISDGMGSVTRFLPSELLRMEQEQLFQFRSWAGSTTGRAA